MENTVEEKEAQRQQKEMTPKKKQRRKDTITERKMWEKNVAHLPLKETKKGEAKYKAEYKQIIQEVLDKEREDREKTQQGIIQRIKAENETIRKHQLKIRLKRLSESGLRSTRPRLFFRTRGSFSRV